jgi:hypothetical protein
MMSATWQWKHLLALCGALSMAGCLADASPDGAGLPQDPPVPRIPCIIPLGLGNEWTFHDVLHDTGTGIGNVTVEQDLSIPRAYGLRMSAGVERISWVNEQEDFAEYYYAYHWTGQANAPLLTFRQDATPPGVYVAGTVRMSDDSVAMLDTAKFWLAYPGTAGAAWQTTLDGRAFDMGLVSTDTVLYYLNRRGGGLSPVDTAHCYLYRQQAGDSTAYYFYNRAIGPLGYQQYVRGTLTRSYLLTNCWVE